MRNTERLYLNVGQMNIAEPLSAMADHDLLQFIHTQADAMSKMAEWQAKGHPSLTPGQIEFDLGIREEVMYPYIFEAVLRGLEVKAAVRRIANRCARTEPQS